jgi:hypothetical protein
MAKSQTLKTEVVQSEKDRIIFKLQQEYTPRVIHFSKPVNSLITLTLDDQGKIKYHKDMWNEKDYSHEGLGKVMKTLNGDHLTKVSACLEERKVVYIDVICRLPNRRRLCKCAIRRRHVHNALEISNLNSIHMSSHPVKLSAPLIFQSSPSSTAVMVANSLLSGSNSLNEDFS